MIRDRRYWHHEPTGESVRTRYRRMRARGFTRRYSLTLALGFDGAGT